MSPLSSCRSLPSVAHPISPRRHPFPKGGGGLGHSAGGPAAGRGGPWRSGCSSKWCPRRAAPGPRGAWRCSAGRGSRCCGGSASRRSRARPTSSATTRGCAPPPPPGGPPSPPHAPPPRPPGEPPWPRWFPRIPSSSCRGEQRVLARARPRGDAVQWSCLLAARLRPPARHFLGARQPAPQPPPPARALPRCRRPGWA